MGPSTFFSYFASRKGVQVPHQKILGSTITVNGVDVIVLEADDNSDIVRCKGLIVPTDASAGFAKGATFIKTDAAVAGVYYNNGDDTSSLFKLVTTA